MITMNVTQGYDCDNRSLSGIAPSDPLPSARGAPRAFVFAAPSMLPLVRDIPCRKGAGRPARGQHAGLPLTANPSGVNAGRPWLRTGRGLACVACSVHL